MLGSALGVATSRWTNCTRHSANSPPIVLARWPGLASAALVFFVADDSIRPLCRCSRGLTRHGTRVVDIELDDLAGEGCGGHQGHALRRLKAVPSALRITTAIIPARRAKDWGGPSSQTISKVAVPSRTWI